MHSVQQARAPRLQGAVREALLTSLRWHNNRLQGFALSKQYGQSILVALGLVAATTLCLMGVTTFVRVHHVSSAYLIPVLIAAIRLDTFAAIVAAAGGIAASAFFFYPPLYDFRVSDPTQLLDLSLFIVVATVTGRLAATARTHAMRAEEREAQMRALYAFSRRLAVATDAAQIYSAIQHHLSSIIGRRVVYFEAGAAPSATRGADDGVPEMVRRAVDGLAPEQGSRSGVWVEDGSNGSLWLVRAVSPRNAAFGSVAIDLGRSSQHDQSSTQDRIDAVLADASAILERLDVARAIGEVKLRAEAETLRAALMGSVSHGLRTPLASIMGSASILVRAPAVSREPQLAELAGIVRDEAERLNSDIQRLLDASRISSAGVRPHLAWADVADIVNAAIASQRRKLSGHQVKVRVADDLPLVNVDPVLIEQALGQLLDNAAKYSSAGSEIRVEACGRGDAIAISVGDDGLGLVPEETEHIFERFYRGPRTRDTTSGSGLGLWIARAFVVACGGTIEAVSEGAGRGSNLTIVLPESLLPAGGASGGHDE